MTCFINQLHIACTSYCLAVLFETLQLHDLLIFPMLLDRIVKFPGVFQNPSIICVISVIYINFVGSKNSFIFFPGWLAESYKL